MSSTASAPAARDSQSWYSSTMNSFRSSGADTARPDGDEVVEAAPEVLLVGEDGDGGRARAGIGAGLGGGIERGIENARGR